MSKWKLHSPRSISILLECIFATICHRIFITFDVKKWQSFVNVCLYIRRKRKYPPEFINMRFCQNFIRTMLHCWYELVNRWCSILVLEVSTLFVIEKVFKTGATTTTMTATTLTNDIQNATLLNMHRPYFEDSIKIQAFRMKNSGSYTPKKPLILCK